MKRNLTCFAALLILSALQNLNAQNGSPYWSLAGNSNAGGAKLGTTNGSSLRLYTKNLERLRIDTAGNVGIGTTNFTDRLQVNSASGKNAFRAQVNGNTKLLVHGNGGVAVGANATPPTNGLYVAGNVGIGTASPSYKLQVDGGSGIAINANSTYIGVYGTSNTYGVYGTSTSSGYGITGYGGTGVYGSSSNSGYGVYGVSSSSYGSGNSIGVYGSAYYGVKANGTIGLYATGTSNGVYASGSDYGVYATGNSYGVYSTGKYIGVFGRGDNSYGVYGYSAYSRGVYGESGNNIGGYFYSQNSNALWAKTASTAAGVYAGVFEGNVYTYGTYQTSDETLKKNVAAFDDALSVINKLKPKHYEFIHEGKYASLALPQGTHYGFLAQELEKELPGLVEASMHELGKPNTTSKPTSSEQISIKAINYIELIPIVVKSIQELDQKTKRIEQLENQVAELRQMVLDLKNGSPTVSLTPASLTQATPNPVKGATRIGYSVPANSRAQLLITDGAGKTIKAITLTGSGYTNLNTASMSSGSYNYSLVIDGKVADTKRLVVVR